MITSVISSVARMSLTPARLAGRMAGSLLSGLRQDVPAGAHSRTSSSRTKTAARGGPKAQSRRATSSRTRSKARPKRATSRSRAKPQPKPAPRRRPLDDATIARRVESTIFQGIDVDKDQIHVDVAERVVSLRGEVRSQDLISELEARAARVAQVRRVQNLLRLPTAPPSRQADSPAPQPDTSDSAAPGDERAIASGETSREVPAPTSGLQTRDFAAADDRRGRAHERVTGGGDSADVSPSGDESSGQAGPDVAELDKDEASQPSDPGLRDPEGG
jgi:osmotically-inducible protein OsmY